MLIKESWVLFGKLWQILKARASKLGVFWTVMSCVWLAIGIVDLTDGHALIGAMMLGLAASGVVIACTWDK